VVFYFQKGPDSMLAWKVIVTTRMIDLKDADTAVKSLKYSEY